MRTRSKLLLAGLAATLLLSFAVSSASANRLSVGERNFRIVWQSLELLISGTSSRCNVTLEGSFHSSTIVKTAGFLIGHVSRASLRQPCTGGTATMLRESLPWHVTYESFEGTLPNITNVSLLLVNMTFRFDPDGILTACLARTTTAPETDFSVRALVAGEVITRLKADESDTIPFSGFGCSSFNGTFRGEGAVTRLATTGTISIRLI